MYFFRKSVDLNLTENYLNKILQWSVNRITNIDELVHDNYKYIWIKPSESALKSMNYDKGDKYYSIFFFSIISNCITEIQQNIQQLLFINSNKKKIISLCIYFLQT